MSTQLYLSKTELSTYCPVLIISLNQQRRAFHKQSCFGFLSELLKSGFSLIVLFWYSIMIIKTDLFTNNCPVLIINPDYLNKAYHQQSCFDMQSGLSKMGAFHQQSCFDNQLGTCNRSRGTTITVCLRPLSLHLKEGDKFTIIIIIVIIIIVNNKYHYHNHDHIKLCHLYCSTGTGQPYISCPTEEAERVLKIRSSQHLR